MRTPWDPICTHCSPVGPCLMHNACAGGAYRGEDGKWHKYDPQADWAYRIKFTEGLRQFRKVLAVIGWVVQWCPRCCGPPHKGAFNEMKCHEGAPW